MNSDECGRCGRQRHADLAKGIPSRPSSADLLRIAGPWASFGGHDICPQCQTSEEQRSALSRVVRMIEREIERRQREGVSTDDLEAALAAFAMRLREEAAEAQVDELEPPDQGGESRSEGALDHRQLRVAFTGAFLTGHPLAVRFDGYRDVQHDVLARLGGPRWRPSDADAADGTYASGGGFRDRLPLVIARRQGDDLLEPLRSVMAADGLSGADPRTTYAPLLAAEPQSLSIDVYDLGVAVMTAHFDVTVEGRASLALTARAIKRLAWLRSMERGRSPLAVNLQKIAAETTREYGEAVKGAAPEELQVAWLARSTSARRRAADTTTASSQEHGRLLWLHPVHVLRVEQPLERTARQLAPAFQETITIDDGGVFAPGIGSSAIVVAPGSDAAIAPIHLTALHWAYYALYMEIDRGLLTVLYQEYWSEEKVRLERLEEDAAGVFADYLHIMDARARLDSHLNALGGDELAIWQSIATVQQFEALETSVDRKLDVLQKLVTRRVDQATAYRARRIANILGYLTVLTVVTVTGGVLSLLAGAGTTPVGPRWRIVILLVALAGASVVYWLAFVRTTRR